MVSPRTLCAIIGSCILLSTVCSAQKQNNIWYFGGRAGIDFNTSPPTPLIDGRIDLAEGPASVADPKTGMLVFYTDGVTVWNRDHKVMSNGTGLHGSASSTQSALIVPKPGSTDIYYIFTAADFESGGYITEGIQYSTVDIRLDGGLGEVTEKNVPLLAPGTEKLTSILHCNSRDIWVVTYTPQNPNINAYLITDAGVSAKPVISSVPLSVVGAEMVIGDLQASPSGERLAAAGQLTPLGSPIAVQLFDFDRSTGIASNPLTITNLEALPYGLCFSPDNSKLYISQRDDQLFQYDLSKSDWAGVLASRTMIGKTQSGIELGGMQIGPDGQIYVARRNQASLGVITKPNASGAACGYIDEAFDLQGRRPDIGLPNPIVFPQRGVNILTVNLEHDTTICLGNSIQLTASGTSSYQWSPEEGLDCADCPNPIATPTSTTTYTVTAAKTGCISSQSVTIVVAPVPTLIPPSDTTVCSGDSVQLTVTGATSYRWYPTDGLSCADCPTPIVAPESTTRYTIIGSNGTECEDSSFVTVSVAPLPTPDAGPDQTICSGSTTTLHASGGKVVGWEPVDGLSCTDCDSPTAEPTTTTTYTVTVANAAGCIGTASTTVTVLQPPPVKAGADVTTCADSPVQLHASGAKTFVWSPAEGLDCTDCPSPFAHPVSTTTYFVSGTDDSGCSARDSVTVTVIPAPIADAGPDTVICGNSTALLSASGGVAFLWSPADGLDCPTCRTTLAHPSITTRYSVTVTNALGCSASDTVLVSIDTASVSARAHIDRRHHFLPGSARSVPLLLDDPLDLAGIDLIDLQFSCDPLILRIDGIDLKGGIAQGWSIENQMSDLATGTYSMRLRAPVGTTLKGTGELLALRVMGFIGATDSSELRFRIDIPTSECTTVHGDDGLVRIDSVCGLSFRLIESNAESFTLDRNRPNPFNPTTDISFSLGLDGPTRLEIFDAAGRTVATLIDDYMKPGRYLVTWDASDYPSGIYYYRLTSGAWSRTDVMTLTK